MRRRRFMGTLLGVSVGALVGAAAMGALDRSGPTAVHAAEERPAQSAAVALDVASDPHGDVAAAPAAPLPDSRHFVQELEVPLDGEGLACRPVSFGSTTKWIQLEFVSVEVQAGPLENLDGYRAFAASTRPSTGQRLVPISLAGGGRVKWGSADVLLFHGPSTSHPKLSVCVMSPDVGQQAVLLAIVSGYTFTP